jgi:hypothetical protein
MSTLSAANLKNPSSGSNNIVLNADGTTTITAPSNIIKSGTAVATTSGTSIDFTGIPSWVKRISLLINGVSSTGTSTYQVQLGTGVGPTFTTSGYSGGSAAVNMLSNGAAETNTTGFRIVSNISAADVYFGIIQLALVTGNTWLESGNLNIVSGRLSVSSGSNALGSALTAIRLTTVNGTDTFDAGSVNIMWEG